MYLLTIRRAVVPTAIRQLCVDMLLTIDALEVSSSNMPTLSPKANILISVVSRVILMALLGDLWIHSLIRYSAGMVEKCLE